MSLSVEDPLVQGEDCVITEQEVEVLECLCHEVALLDTFFRSRDLIHTM